MKTLRTLYIASRDNHYQRINLYKLMNVQRLSRNRVPNKCVREMARVLSIGL